jgi:hypothetical protein
MNKETQTKQLVKKSNQKYLIKLDMSKLTCWVWLVGQGYKCHFGSFLTKIFGQINCDLL